MNRETSSDQTRLRAPVRIGEWVLYADLGLLRGVSGQIKSQERKLTPKALEVLLVLIDAGNQGVSRESILDSVWGERYPSDQVVSRAIADLRSAFGESAGQKRYLRTIPKFGYQLVLPAEPVSEAPVDSSRHPVQNPKYWWTAVIVLTMAIAFWMYPKPELTLSILTPVPVTSAPGLEHQPRLSPDGEWLLYAVLHPERSDWDLQRVAWRDGSVLPVADDPSVAEHGAVFSPDGGQLAYVRFGRQDCQLSIQPVHLGQANTLAPCTQKFPTLVDWSPDGQWLAYTTDEQTETDGKRRIYRIPVDGGKSARISDAVSDSGSDFYPRISPNGRYVAFLRGEPHPDHRTTLWLASSDGSQERPLMDRATAVGGISWLDDSRLLVSAADDAGTLQSFWLDVDDGDVAPIDLPALLHPELRRIDDQYLLAAVQPRRELDLAILEADGEQRPVAVSTFDDRDGRYSPDGQWLAFISRRSGFDELWLASEDGLALRRLTRFGGVRVHRPVWFPDGLSILIAVDGADRRALYRADIVSGQLTELALTHAPQDAPSFVDGDQFVYACQDTDEAAICLHTGSDSRVAVRGLFRPQALSGSNIAAIDAAGLLWRINLVDDSRSLIWDRLPGQGRFGWHLDGQELLYLTAGNGAEVGRLMRRNIKTGEAELLLEQPMPTADTTISVNTRTGAVLFTRYRASSDDLILYENLVLK